MILKTLNIGHCSGLQIQSSAFFYNLRITHWRASVWEELTSTPISSSCSKTVRRFKRKHLTVVDCHHLARSHLAVTQPFSQRWTNRDPNHGLYPRPRTKGRNRGMASVSKSVVSVPLNVFRFHISVCKCHRLIFLTCYNRMTLVFIICMFSIEILSFSNVRAQVSLSAYLIIK
jgi:hypothetical protein